jgi:hypothetical protein
LPDFAASTAGFGAALAGLFGSALRAVAGGADLDGFDFATTFFVFDATFAMATDHPTEGWGLRALHHVLPVPCKARNLKFRR